MRAHIDAVKALLGSLPYAVFYGDVTGSPTYPYIMLWSGTGSLDAAEADGVQDDLNDLLGVTMVAQNPDGVLAVAAKVRPVLMGARPTVAGRKVHPLRLFSSQPVRPDESVKLPNTDAHPAYGVDQYRLLSEPA